MGHDSGYAIDSSPEMIAEGRVVYQTNCANCHGDATTPPPLPGAPPHTADGHTWHHSDGQLVSWVLNGVPNGQVMPKFFGTLTQSEVEASIAFIKTFWPDEIVRMQARGMH
jgi:mono/diheme cytochrome c family protein